MTGEYTSTGLAAKAYKDAFFTTATAQYASDSTVRVSFGHPGPGMQGFDNLVVLKNVRMTADWATMTNRHTREVALELDVEFSAFIAGSALPDDQEASEKCLSMLDVMDAYCRRAVAYGGDTTLGNTVRWCMLTTAESAGVTENDFLAQGRLIVLLATFTAAVRITD